MHSSCTHAYFAIVCDASFPKKVMGDDTELEPVEFCWSFTMVMKILFED